MYSLYDQNIINRMGYIRQLHQHIIAHNHNEPYNIYGSMILPGASNSFRNLTEDPSAPERCRHDESDNDRSYMLNQDRARSSVWEVVQLTMTLGEGCVHIYVSWTVDLPCRIQVCCRFITLHTAFLLLSLPPPYDSILSHTPLPFRPTWFIRDINCCPWNDMFL